LVAATRSSNVKTFLATLVMTAALAASALAAQTVPYLPVPHDAAVILNTGSTNAIGYRIVVTRSGRAQYVTQTVGTGMLPAKLTRQFFADLAAAMPLSGMPKRSCMKSMSFGASVFVWWRGQRSPDLSCSARHLNDDADAIARSLGVGLKPRGLVVPQLPNEPRKAIPSPIPTR
jgi:hypothetical protein